MTVLVLFSFLGELSL